MKNISVIAGIVGIVIALAIVDSHAQRGQGQGRGKPPTTTPGTGAGKPSGTPATQGSSQDDHGAGKGSSHAASSNAKPTVSQLVTQNTNLSSTLQSLLPGTNLQTASAGFRTLGQFVAAAHVSHNLDIPFDQLKGKVTGPNAESLGKAIHDLKPTADANAEAKKAEKSANADVKAAQNKKATS